MGEKSDQREYNIFLKQSQDTVEDHVTKFFKEGIYYKFKKKKKKKKEI